MISYKIAIFFCLIRCLIIKLILGTYSTDLFLWEMRLISGINTDFNFWSELFLTRIYLKFDIMVDIRPLPVNRRRPKRKTCRSTLFLSAAKEVWLIACLCFPNIAPQKWNNDKNKSSLYLLNRTLVSAICCVSTSSR